MTNKSTYRDYLTIDGSPVLRGSSRGPGRSTLLEPVATQGLYMTEAFFAVGDGPGSRTMVPPRPGQAPPPCRLDAGIPPG